MNDYQKESANSQPEHLDISIKFSNEMTERFDANQRNEVLFKIKALFQERLLSDISDAEKNLACLKDASSKLQSL